MSFSSMVKEELIKCPIKILDEKKVEIYGLIEFSKMIQHDCKFFCENLYAIKRTAFILYGNQNKYNKKSNSVYYVSLNNDLIQEMSANTITELIKNSILTEQFLPQILRSIFLSCGSVTNPKSDYHLEFTLKDKAHLDLVISIIENIKIINIKPKIINRKNGYSIYIKDNSQITDILTYIGATNSSMEFMQVKMMKEIRNYVNRTTNFETANITKTTLASIEQIDAIKKIINTVGLKSLPKQLKETAILRLKNPYMSLEELSTLFSKPITKSGVNYRLKKLIKYLKSLK